jgi:hypothetical protein
LPSNSSFPAFGDSIEAVAGADVGDSIDAGAGAESKNSIFPSFGESIDAGAGATGGQGGGGIGVAMYVIGVCESVQVY